MNNPSQIEYDNEAELLKLSMKSLKEHYGFNPGKHRKSARDIGYQLGLELANHLTAKGFDPVIDELASYWNQHGIGEMAWENRTGRLLRIRSCSDCIGTASGAGYTMCPFKEGLLEAVLKTKTDSSFNVQEVECCGTLAPYCVFQINEASNL